MSMRPLKENERRTRVSIDDFQIVEKVSRNLERRANPHDPQISASDYAERYLEFTDKGPTIFHAIEFLVRDLEDAGFTYLNERESWDDVLESDCTRFFTIRNGSALLAFVRGRHWKPSHGMAVSGAHTDNLTLQVKPTSLRPHTDGFELLGVAPYSGALNSTWWDRDLGIGGRIVVREGRSITTKLVRIPHPIARISTLAPHFGTPATGPFNMETQAVPVIGLWEANCELKPTPDESKSPLINKHSLRLLRAISRYSNVAIKDMLELELHMFDTQPATLAGLDKEFIFAPRIDDKVCTYVSFRGLIEAAENVEQGNTLAVAVGYDSEEVGSLSRNGARGNLLEATVDRILGPIAESDKAVFYANSFFLSADVTHAVNPCFSDVYLEHHKPRLNVGMTITRDPNGNMITDAVSAALVNEVARRTGNKLQEFQIRNDSRSGGTIGPALSSKTGLRGVDIGVAQLSMHSIRAAMGSKDPYLGVRFFKNFFEVWKDVDLEFKLGDL